MPITVRSSTTSPARSAPFCKREDLASRPDLEELRELTTPDEGPDPRTDLAVGPERGNVRNG